MGPSPLFYAQKAQLIRKNLQLCGEIFPKPIGWLASSEKFPERKLARLLTRGACCVAGTDASEEQVQQSFARQRQCQGAGGKSRLNAGL